MATIRRFFVENVGKEAVLCGDEYSHAKNVLRLQEGDEVVLLDGSGTEYDAIISKVSKGEMLCTVTGRRPSDKECRTRVRLLIGALKGDKTELVVQKATELGVAEIAVFSLAVLFGVFQRKQAGTPAEGRAGGGKAVSARHRSFGGIL